MARIPHSFLQNAVITRLLRVIRRGHRNEGGYIFPVVLGLFVLVSLIIPPLLSFTTTALTSVASEERRSYEYYAADGYTTSLPLSHLEDHGIIMAYAMNGLPLLPERGFPFTLVAESKWGYKWIRWITRIELSDDTGYRGYWERRGYSNEADLDEGFFGSG